MLKTITLALCATLTITSIAAADEYVRGYVKRDGTYVQPHYRSSPDSSYNNNYSTQGNTNPYTGQQGSGRQTWNDRTPESNTKSYGDSNYNTNTNTNPYGSYGGYNYKKRGY